MQRPVRYAVPRLVAALFLAGVGIVPVAGLGAGPADAAVCNDSTGVTVVVDFHELGGGVQTVCDPDGAGKTASKLFPDNGFPLDYVQRTPGFVCRVSGKPADDPCVNTPPSDAYWGLFWSNGINGQWSYASAGAGGQKIPAGGSIAFSWQGSSSRNEPGVAPPQHSSQPSSPSSSPTSKPSSGGATGSGGSGSPSSGPASGSATGTATSPPTSTGPHHKAGGKRDGAEDNESGKPSKHHDRPSSSPSAGSETSAAQPEAPATVPASNIAEQNGGDSGGLPGWVPVSAIGVLTALLIAAGLHRRRQG